MSSGAMDARTRGVAQAQVTTYGTGAGTVGTRSA